MKGRAIGAIFVVAMFSVTYFCFDGELFIPLLVMCFGMGLCELQALLHTNTLLFRNDYRFRASVPIECAVFITALLCCWLNGTRASGLVVLCCCISDTFAWAFGSAFGKNNRVKFLSDVSPKKSWVGFIAGFIGPAAVVIPGIAILEQLNLASFTTEMRRIAIIYACFAGLASEFGDLLESAAKRTLQVKDSCESLVQYPLARIVEAPLRGHGGYLDRFDSMAFCMIIMYGVQKIMPLV